MYPAAHEDNKSGAMPSTFRQLYTSAESRRRYRMPEGGGRTGVERQAVPAADGDLADCHATQRGHAPRLALVAPVRALTSLCLGTHAGQYALSAQPHGVLWQAGMAVTTRCCAAPLLPSGENSKDACQPSTAARPSPACAYHGMMDMRQLSGPSCDAMLRGLHACGHARACRARSSPRTAPGPQSRWPACSGCPPPASQGRALSTPHFSTCGRAAGLPATQHNRSFAASRPGP